MSMHLLFLANFLIVFSIGALEWDHFAEIGLGTRYDCMNSSEHSHFLKLTSKEKWKVEIFQVSGKYRALVNEKIYFKAAGGCGWVFNGNESFDQFFYQIDEKKWLTACTSGRVYDLLFEAGYRLPCKCLSIIPLIGYSFHQQKLKGTHFRDHIYLVNFFDNNRSHVQRLWVSEI